MVLNVRTIQRTVYHPQATRTLPPAVRIGTHLGHEADVGRDDGAAVPGEDERLPQGHVLMLRKELRKSCVCRLFFCIGALTYDAAAEARTCVVIR